MWALAVAAGLLLLSLWDYPVKDGPTFVSPAPLVVGLGGAHPARERTIPSANIADPRGSDSRCAVAGACLALLAASLARRYVPRSSVVMHWRRPLGANKKGKKPMINRWIARDYMVENMKWWTKKFSSAQKMENLIQKQMYGKFSMDISSRQFTDDIPLLHPTRIKQFTKYLGDASQLGNGWAWNTTFLIRKFRDPAKFKKLEIPTWEMPEGADKVVTLDELIDAGFQYGQASRRWCSEMLKYLYTDMEGTHIFDLVQSAYCMNRAAYYCMEAASKGAQFLFVGSKETAHAGIEEAANKTGMHFCTKYVPGTLTNFLQVRRGLMKMKALQAAKAQGSLTLPSGTVCTEKELYELIRKYRGVVNMKKIPDIVVFVDAVKERALVEECTHMGIPAIGLVDSNSRLRMVDLPVPGNASGHRSVNLFLRKISDAVARGQQIASTTTVDIPTAWDPWMFSLARDRSVNHRGMRQPWHKDIYGSYEKWKTVHPYGDIKMVPPYDPNFRLPKFPGKGGWKKRK